MNKQEFKKELFDNVATEYRTKNALGEVAWQLKRIADNLCGEEEDE